MGDKNFDREITAVKLERARQIMPLAERSYAILFTPRSGSSWLTDICEKTGRLSRPDECFNPGFLPVMARALGARDMDEYVELLRRNRNTFGLYGCQLTYHQLKTTFGKEDAFMRYFKNATFFWLIRKDIVAQAVSLAKMVKTSVSHGATASEEKVSESDRIFEYDSANIKHWLNHILAAEIATERFLSTYGLAPVRLSYEGITKMGSEAVLEMIGHHVGVDLTIKAAPQSLHRKISTDVNKAYAERFVEEEHVFLRQVGELRKKMLDLCAV